MLTHYCDYCGEPIDEEAGQLRVGIEGAGILNRSRKSNQAPKVFHYHGTNDSYEECCYDRAMRPLQDQAAWAHGPKDETQMTWILVRRRDARPITFEESTRRYRESDLPSLPHSQRTALIHAGLWKLEQLALCDAEELEAISGVGPKTIEVLRRSLAEQGMELREEVAS